MDSEFSEVAINVTARHLAETNRTGRGRSARRRRDPPPPPADRTERADAHRGVRLGDGEPACPPQRRDEVGLDDFGIGYSSLAYLRQFPLDFVKIDRHFIRDLDRHPGERAIVAAIIGLCHARRPHGRGRGGRDAQPTPHPQGSPVRPGPGLPLRPLVEPRLDRQVGRRRGRIGPLSTFAMSEGPGSSPRSSSSQGAATSGAGVGGVASEVHRLSLRRCGPRRLQSPHAAPPTSAVAPPGSPTLTATPLTSLVDGQQVEIQGTAFAGSGEVVIAECKSGVTSDSECDGSDITTVSTDQSGSFSTSFVVARVISASGDTIDCAQAGACVVAAANLPKLSVGAVTPVSFYLGRSPAVDRPSGAVGVTARAGWIAWSSVAV